MTLAQFSMVEELASLVKDNYPCKYLILSVEDLLVNCLQDDTSLDAMLELEPMNSYDRLLVHRLAEIFGFSHHSVGEGQDRHLVLERSPETSIPGILVSDLLLEYGEMQSPMTCDVLRRKEAFPGKLLHLEGQTSTNCCMVSPQSLAHVPVCAGQKFDAVRGPSLDERETAYFAARQRIFSEDACDSKLAKERPKKDPEVARRMITRALGQADKGTKHEFASNDTKECGEMVLDDVKIKYTNSSNKIGTSSLSGKNPRACTRMSKICKSEVMDGWSPKAQEKNNSNSLAGVKKESPGNYIRQEHMGAAKRLFANALRNHPRDVNLSKTHESEETGC